MKWNGLMNNRQNDHDINNNNNNSNNNKNYKTPSTILTYGMWQDHQGKSCWL